MRRVVLALLMLAAPLAASGAWYMAQPRERFDKELHLAAGVVARWQCQSSPRPARIHSIAVDLSRPGIEFVVTPADLSTSYPFSAKTTLDFLRDNQLLVAINGDYFSPWRCAGPWNYYPRAGDRVAPLGPSIAAGKRFAPSALGYFAKQECTLYLSRDGRAAFSEPLGEPFNAISGGPMLLKKGKPTDCHPGEPCPQSAIGLDRSGRWLLFVVVDGRQTGYSEGLDNAELAHLLLEFGCWTAMRLDGGGSSTLCAKLPDGKTSVLNRPIHAGVPGWQRPVANHLGLRIK